VTKLRVSAGIRVAEHKSPEQAKQALLKLAQYTIQEPECYQFDVLQDKADPYRFTLWECFENEAALAAHFQQPHTLEYLKQEWTEVEYSERLIHLTEGKVAA